jgi:AraC-like DNA-binding protein
MDFELFKTLIRNLLKVAIYDLTTEGETLDRTETKFCYSTQLQPMFARETLTYLVANMADHCYYEIVDDLGFALLLFSFEGHKFLMGPYVKKSFDEKQVHQLLVQHHVPASYMNTLRLYHSSLSIIGTYHFQTEIYAIMQSFTPPTPEYSYRRLQGLKEEITENKKMLQDPYDYDTIYQRYDTENQFMRMIATGNVEAATQTMHHMAEQSAGDTSFLDSSTYSNPLSAFAIVRVLARKAAESGGLSVITIDEITQRNVQFVNKSGSVTEMSAAFHDMIVELTTKVREQKALTGQYPPYIRQTMEYISLNYSQQLTLPMLAERVHLSSSHLERQFKGETGMTISYYIASIRCDAAADLLLHSDQAISDISFYVGYSDNNYFVKVFKKHYGKTPSAYRKEHAV